MNSIPRRALALFGCACIVSTAAMSAEPERAPPPGHMMGEHGPRGMQLDEAQQDKVFAIVHAQEPQLREQAKAARHAHEALHAMAATGQFDEAKAAALAQALGKAEATLALLRARTDAQVNALLRPEQRRQKAEHGPRGERRPEPRPDQRPEPRQ
ncbi:MAG: periplasmic heavy metal sensor [Pseudomonadota bacterium]|nr:periplasmic heavy metal sensor [Pseudomonadota bacterium]